MTLSSPARVTLYGPDGEPIPLAPGGSSAGRRSPQAAARSFGASDLGFIRSLASLASADPSVRAQEPMRYHAWVYAAAMAVAVNIASVEYFVYRETDEALGKRRMIAAKHGVTVPRAGHRRSARDRFLTHPNRRRGRAIKELEPLPDHPLSDVLRRPHRTASKTVLFAVTAMWMKTRGECVWLKLDAEGQPVGVGEFPAQLVPVDPSSLRPVFKDNEHVGWIYTVATGTGMKAVGRQIPLFLDQVVQFKFFNPFDPVRGLSPIAAAAAGIELDMLDQSRVRSVLVNGADPGGIIYDESGQHFRTETQREEFKQQFKEEYGHAQNTGETVIMPPGIKYQRIGLSQVDMQAIEMRGWDREEILAVMQVPKSVVSVTDDLNYSIQLSQDANFWTNCNWPLMRLIEDEIDSSLLFPITDDIVGMFDTTGVDALRVGLAEKVAIVKDLVSESIHMPPRDAFEVVGLDVKEYPGDDVVIGTGLGAPLDLTGEDKPPAPPPPALPPADDGGDGDTPDDEDGQDGTSGRRVRGASPSDEAKQVKNQSYWRKFVADLMTPFERDMAPSWLQFARAQQQLQVKRLRELASDVGLESKGGKPRFKVNESDLEARILIPLPDSQLALLGAARPVYASNLIRVFQFTKETDFGGVALFEPDDQLLVNFINTRSRLLINTAPVTIRKNLIDSLTEAIRNGEPLKSWVGRVNEVYGQATTSAKALSVARTEAGSFLNGSRDQMFGAQGFEIEEWISAGDENTRKSHVHYGGLGPQKRGFNYLESRAAAALPPRSGRLEFPHDSRATADEVVACRCVKVPVS